MVPELISTIERFAKKGNITILTGAGISAESGIPTFRGPEGYWTVGSQAYHPQEMATHRMFLQEPIEVWKWYLYRLAVCRAAAPNPGHFAIATMEALLGDRFTLVTQNVDGLHLRAGNSLERTYQIHGNVDFMRCAEECSRELYRVPHALHGWSKERNLNDDEKALLQCPRCPSMTRPHVLWFDEIYNEPLFRLESTLAVARNTDLLIVVGTAGATNLPNQVAWLAAQRRDAVIVDINIEMNPFAALAQKTGGFFVQAESGRVLPEMVAVMQNALSA